jgi:hypothetical protein
MAAYAVVLPATKATMAPVAINTVRNRGCLMVMHLALHGINAAHSRSLTPSPQCWHQRNGVIAGAGIDYA